MAKIYAYKQGSASAIALAAGLGINVLKREGSKWKPKGTVINWGCSELPFNITHECLVLNQPHKVKLAANKLEAFNKFQEWNNLPEGAMQEGHSINYPQFTEDAQDVQAWLDNERTAVVRHKLTGHSGEGIEIISGDVEIPAAPLYVQYIKKKYEYRVHVMSGEVVDVQRKARSKDVPDEQVNWQVRNHANGFIYAREGFETPQSVEDQACLAVEALGLDFGAVDIIWNEKEQKPYVLEVNCAPGLTGQTLEGYVNRFKELL